jgi:His/Glu/Gln/Arg/opine family amino acid ABC transporter permease subunit
MQVSRWDGFFDYLFNAYLLEGALLSITLTVTSRIGGRIIGIGIALLCLSGNRMMSGVAVFYCWIFRGTPLLVQLLITWPQAMRVVIPPLGNSVNGLLKTTSVASVISMEELLRRTQILIQERFLVLELFMVAALYYLLMTTAWEFVQRRLEKLFGRGYANESADRR